MRRLTLLPVMLLIVRAVLCVAQTTKGSKKGSSTKSTKTTKSTGSHKGGGSSAANGFTLECSALPFESIATKPDPFVQCDDCGVVSSKATPDAAAAGAAFSHAKNNFCADFSQPTPVTFTILRAMQKQAAAKGLVTRTISDRSKLHNFFTIPNSNKTIGEGDVVRLVAWINQAHISDCASGETVNCDIPGFASNDLHIVLMDPTTGGPAQDECSSATAEMNPHFRPAAWSSLDLKTPNKNVVRFTGTLFFDNAHRPCKGLKKAQGDAAPFRSSIWEIHPVYQLEVCAKTNAKQCDVNSNDASLWVPYDKWVAQSGSSTIPTGKTLRGKCHSGQQKAGMVVPQCTLNAH